MSSTSKVLSQAQLGKTVLENLNDKSVASSLQSLLDTALQNKLSNYFKTNQQIQQAIARIQSIDFAKEANTAVRDFLTKNVENSLTDPQAKQLFANSLSKIPQNLTLASLLGLNTPINSNPVFQDTVKYSNAAALLKTSSLPTNLLGTVLEIYQKYNYYPSDAFWNELGQNADLKPHVDDLKFAMLLYNLIGNISLIKEVQILRDANYVKMPQDLVNVDWSKVITDGVAKDTITIPSNIQGKTVDEKITNYIASVITTVENAFPTAAFARDLPTYKEFSQALGNDTIKDFTTFFSNCPDFDLRKDNIRDYLTKNKEIAFTGIPSTSNRQALTSALLKLQRLFRITTNNQEMAKIIGNGFGSSYEIAKIPRKVFAKKVNISEDRASQIYENAMQNASRSLALLMKFSSRFNHTQIAAVGEYKTLFEDGQS